LNLKIAAQDLKSRGRQWLVAKGLLSHRSYSQCGEDLIIQFLFNGMGVVRPSYLDLGAHHPTYLSNTRLFYADGCRGINIEANPELIANFRWQRPRDLNLNIGIVSEEHDGETIDFYVMNVSAMSTFSSEEARRLEEETSVRLAKTISVPVRGVLSVIHQYCGGRFPDLLTVDIEGTDALVVPALSRTDSSRRPRVICIETLTYSESGTATKKADLIAAIVATGYELYADTYINTIFRRSDCRG
jgi:FkbM family methyltransferase